MGGLSGKEQHVQDVALGAHMATQLELGAEQGEHSAAFLLSQIPTSGRRSPPHVQHSVGHCGENSGLFIGLFMFLSLGPVDFMCVSVWVACGIFWGLWPHLVLGGICVCLGRMWHLLGAVAPSCFRWHLCLSGWHVASFGGCGPISFSNSASLMNWKEREGGQSLPNHYPSLSPIFSRMGQADSEESSQGGKGAPSS